MQAITTKFVPATNTKGSRVQVKSWMGTTYFNWDHALNSDQNHIGAVKEHIEKKLVSEYAPRNPAACGSLPDESGYCVIVDSAKPFDDAAWDQLIQC